MMIDLELSDEIHLVNPFHFGPTNPDEFVGRWPLIREIARQVAYGPNSYACIGGRRFGKSSVLCVLEYVLMNERSLHGRLLTVRVDPMLNKYTSTGSVFANLLADICSRALDMLKLFNYEETNSDSTSKTESHRTSIAQTIIESLAVNLAEDVSASIFGHAVNKVLDALAEINGPRRVVILLDEMDSFLDMPDHIDLFGQLRASIYDGPASNRLRLVLAGSSRFVREETSRGSPLWNMLQKQYLVTFDEKGFGDLVASIPELNDGVRQALWVESGGHPFIIVYFLYHLKQQLLDHPEQPLATENVDDLVKRFMYQEIEHLNGWSKAVGLTGLQIYALFLEEADWLPRRQIVARVADPKVDVTSAISTLCYHGFIVPDTSWGHFRRGGMLFSRWYQNEIERLIHELTPPETTMPMFFHDLILHGPLQNVIDQRWQQVKTQTNIAGGVDTSGGMVNTGELTTSEGDIVGRDSNNDAR